MRSFVAGCATIVLSVASASETRSLFGHWTGHLVVDSQTVLRSSTTPEHRKLLLYAIGRLRGSNLYLHLSPSGRFEWKFEDGYPPDTMLMRGIWFNDGSGIALEHPRRGAAIEHLVIKGDGAKLVTTFNHIEGVTAVFTRRG